MKTNFAVTGVFNITVECACAGPEHEDGCQFDGELMYEAADNALAGNVDVSYEEFKQR